MPNGVLSPAASAGTQRPRRQVCSLPEEAAVGGREAQALHEVLPSRLLQRVSWLGARRGGREGGSPAVMGGTGELNPRGGGGMGPAFGTEPVWL